MIFLQPWITFAVFAAMGLLGYNVCAKLGGGDLPPVIFASVMYASGFLAIIPIFLFFIRGKDSGFLSSLTVIPLLYAMGAGISVILVDTCISAMYGKGAPLSLGMTMVQVLALMLTLIVGVVFMSDKYSLVNIAGIILALISVPLMLYSVK